MEDTSGLWVIAGMIAGLACYMLGIIAYEKDWLGKLRRLKMFNGFRRYRRRLKAARWVGVKLLDPAGRSWTAISSSGGVIIIQLDGTTQCHAINDGLIGTWYRVAPGSGV